jgi:NAD(P)-dependent dehydrogenase (short-subunit alcohol dehydrogenase family)
MTKVAVIVGAGDAIASAVGRRFGNGGYTVCLVRRSAEKAAPHIAAIEAAGGKAHAFACDARDETALTALFETIERDVGPVEVFATGYSADWLARLDAAQVPCAPVLTRRELLSDPQIAANGLIVEFDQPALGRVRQARPAARFDRTPSGAPGPAPGLGEHTQAILRELGLS